MQTKMIFLTGPTAVGKTDLSLEIAKRINGEILSMDSMQIYKGMDIGTAKASKEEQKIVLHHLLDLCEPGERFTVHDYQRIAEEKIVELRSRGKVPIFVGGTGLYLDSIRYGYSFAQTKGSKGHREKLARDYDSDGGKALFERLRRVDPASARKMHIHQKKRLIRALEVYDLSEKPMGIAENRKLRDSLTIVLTMDRTKLYERINQRVEAMVAKGLLDEVYLLLQKEIPLASQAMQAIGYKEAVWYFKGLITLPEMKRLIARNSRKYAKRQLTWFRRDPNNEWFDKEERKKEELFARIDSYLEGSDERI